MSSGSITIAVHRLLRLVYTLFLLIAGIRLAEAQPPQYTIHDLGAGAIPVAINKSGQVAGYIFTSDNHSHAFRTAPNSAINPATDDLGTLGGASSVALGINASGQVVGESTTASGETHGFRTAANALINPATDDIGTLGGNPTYTVAMGINDSGQVVGGSRPTTGYYLHAFRTAPNSAINPATDDIGTGTFSPTRANFGNSGFSINKAGDVAGGYVPVQYYSAFVYAGGTITEIPGFLLAPGLNFTGINDQGQVAGNAQNYPGGIQVWQNGTLTTVLTPDQCDCVPTAINNSLQMVGNAISGTYYSFLYTGRVVYKLSDLIPPGSGWVLNGATPAINDLGQIVGTGSLNGTTHAFRLDPGCAAPSITDVSASPSVIWPPNHKFVPVSIGYTGKSSCEASYSLSVSGNGGSSVVVDAHNVEVAADKDIVYTITVIGTTSGGTTTASVQVSVPHDEGH